MQQINISLRILDGVNASVVDEYNQLQNWTASIVRGMNAELVLKLFSSTTQDSAMAQADLDYASWDFVMCDDWDTATDPQIRVSSGITVDEDGLIHIPLTDTNTEELIAALGTADSVTLGCELCGFATGETPPSFVLQWGISVRNRRSDAGTGTPTAVPDGSYNAAQVDALLAAKANSADIIIYVEGTGIDITDGIVSIDTTGATTGQVLKKTESGVGWEEETVELPEIIEGDNDKVLTVVSGTWAKADAPDGVTTASVQSALSIDTSTGSLVKVLSERGTFVDLPDGGGGGTDGITPSIDPTTKNWFIGETDTGIKAEGVDGTNGTNGTNGTDGVDGVTPSIDPTTKHWFIGGVDTGIKAEGVDGEDGGEGATYTAGDGIAIANEVVSIDVTGATTGQVLKKTELGIGWANDEIGTSVLPTVTVTDNDKVLTVVNGNWEKATVPIKGEETLTELTGSSVTVAPWTQSKWSASGICSLTASGWAESGRQTAYIVITLAAEAIPSIIGTEAVEDGDALSAAGVYECFLKNVDGKIYFRQISFTEAVA